MRQIVLLVGLWICASAAAAQAAPTWKIYTAANTVAVPGGTQQYFVQLANVGDEATTGVVTLEVALPLGLTGAATNGPPGVDWDCPAIAGATTFTCTFTEPVDTLNSLNASVTVNMAPSTSGDPAATFTVSGGGAASAASVVDPTRIGPGPAEFGIDAFDLQILADRLGTPFTQAGGHPDSVTTWIDFNRKTHPLAGLGAAWPVEPVKDIFVDLPPGLVGNPKAASKCTIPELANTEIVRERPLCLPSSQVGTALLAIGNGIFRGDPIAVYNLVPPPNVPARFGFNIAGTVVTMDAELRGGPEYGLSVNVRNAPEGLAIIGTKLTFWGVPSDPSHDSERSCPGELPPYLFGGPACKTDAARTWFLRNPTSCIEPGIGLPTTVRVDSWFDPGDFKSASTVSHLPAGYPLVPAARGAAQGTTNCDLVPFEPTLSTEPESPARSNAPSGFSFDLELPQSDDPDVVGQSDLRKAVVTLPEGVRISPPSAEGLAGCSPQQIALNSTAEPTCPDASKVGTLRIETPVLDQPLTGAIHLATPHDNPSNTLVALYLVARGPGLIVKLTGRIDPDPVTGQLRATFDNTPQLPFSHLLLSFTDDDSRAPLVTPPVCGTYDTRAVLTGWNGKTVISTSSFKVERNSKGGPCSPLRFAPKLTAGTENPVAGKHSSFLLALTREDDEEEIGSLNVSMPPGLIAKIAGIPLCSAVQATAGTCSDASRIGSVTVGAGAGPDPFYIDTGRIYLTAPYNGGQFGLSIVVPAKAGPFDLGDVVVRAAIKIDPKTAAVRIVTDPLPTIREGIPLQVRDIRTIIDRPRFFLNPTDCDPKLIRAAVGSTKGSRAMVSSRFQVGDCGALPLRPKLRLRVGAKGRTRSGSSTPLVAKLTQTRGQANLKSVSVVLPKTLNAHLDVVNDACTPAQFEAGDCERARTGRAVAATPLLDKPLRGNAYFVKRASGKGLPNLVVALRGQVDFDLVGKVVIPSSNRLSTRFDMVPDVPIRSFTLRLAVGKNGALGAAANLCSPRAKRATAAIGFKAQNGKFMDLHQRLKVVGCTK